MITFTTTNKTQIDGKIPTIYQKSEKKIASPKNSILKKESSVVVKRRCFSKKRRSSFGSTIDEKLKSHDLKKSKSYQEIIVEKEKNGQKTSDNKSSGELLDSNRRKKLHQRNKLLTLKFGKAIEEDVSPEQQSFDLNPTMKLCNNNDQEEAQKNEDDEENSKVTQNNAGKFARLQQRGLTLHVVKMGEFVWCILDEKIS